MKNVPLTRLLDVVVRASPLFYVGKGKAYFLLEIVGTSTHHRRKLMIYLELWGNAESETCAF